MVSLGTAKLNVIKGCGDPDRKTVNEGRYVTTESWTYNLGPGNFVYLLTFESDRLTSIEEKGRGYFTPSKVLQPMSEPKIVIKESVSDTKLVYTWVKGSVKNEGGSSARMVRIIVRALDGNGNLVNMGEAYSDPDRLTPGEDATFSVPIKKDSRIEKFSLQSKWELDL